MISRTDIDIFKIESEDERGRYSIMPIALGFPTGFVFEALSIHSQQCKKGLIEKILVDGLRIHLSNNLILDSLNEYFLGKFAEAIIIINIALEVFVEEFLTEKYISEGNDNKLVEKKVDDLFDGKFHKTMRKAFFSNITDKERAEHEIWIKFENVRTKRRQVIHPHTKMLSNEETYQAIIDVLYITQWIMKTSYKSK